MKTKCEFCGIEHWDWFHTKFSYPPVKLAKMSHNELLSVIIRESEKNIMERTDWDALICSLNHNVFVMKNSERADSWIHKRNVVIFNELIAIAEKRDRMSYIARCEELQKELYQKHLDELKAGV